MKVLQFECNYCSSKSFWSIRSMKGLKSPLSFDVGTYLKKKQGVGTWKTKGKYNYKIFCKWYLAIHFSM